MNAKIFVVCHDPSQAYERFSAPYVPICVGDKKEEFPSWFLRDDEGENIADKNAVFNEMTAIYWVYKHLKEAGNPDIIGFVHYRRFFAFAPDARNYEERTKFTDEFFDEIEVDGNKIEKIFSEYDFIAPLPAYRESVESNFKKAHGDDLKTIDSIIDECNPKFSTAKDEYFKGNKAYFFNMFVFRREIFERYCNLIFPILFDFEKRKADPTERMFVSERLTGAFITQLENEGLKGCYMPVTCVLKKPTLKECLKKAERNGKSNFLYKIKPIVEWLTPRRVMLAYRKKKYDRFADLRTKV